MKVLPPATKKLTAKSSPGKQSRAAPCKPEETRSFMMIREKEFPQLFAENAIVRNQRMSKYFDEQDYNSDSETIERNKGDLLADLFKTIERTTKKDPSKFIENMKNPHPETAEIATQATTPMMRTRQTAQKALDADLESIFCGESLADDQIEIDLVSTVNGAADN